MDFMAAAPHKMYSRPYGPKERLRPNAYQGTFTCLNMVCKAYAPHQMCPFGACRAVGLRCRDESACTALRMPFEAPFIFHKLRYDLHSSCADHTKHSHGAFSFSSFSFILMYVFCMMCYVILRHEDDLISNNIFHIAVTVVLLGIDFYLPTMRVKDHITEGKGCACHHRLFRPV